MPTTGLRVESIRKRFGQVDVLRDVALAVAEGEFATLLGPSGCGKTTLLRIVAGLELPDAGRVELDGRDITAEPANRRPVNTVFQTYALFPHLDVRGNVAFGLRSRGVLDREVRTRVDEALALLRIEELAGRRVDALSGGQRQRVALARALVNRPRLLLLDEPLSALDAQLRGEVQVELRRLQRRLGTAFLLVTHDQDEAMTVSDRILVMDAGRIVQAGAPAEVYERPASRFVAAFLGAANLIPVRRRDGALEAPFGRLEADRRPAWEEGWLAIRPERVLVHPAGDADDADAGGNRAVGELRDAVYRGDHVDCFIRLPGFELRARLPPGHRCAPGGADAGARVRCELPAAHLRVLDA